MAGTGLLVASASGGAGALPACRISATTKPPRPAACSGAGGMFAEHADGGLKIAAGNGNRAAPWHIGTRRSHR
jgi:hypothetical protein